MDGQISDLNVETEKYLREFKTKEPNSIFENYYRFENWYLKQVEMV